MEYNKLSFNYYLATPFMCVPKLPLNAKKWNRLTQITHLSALHLG